MTRYILSKDGNLCTPNDATEDAEFLIDWPEFYALRQRAEQSDAYLLNYGHHLAECDYIVNMLPCTCGFEEVRAMAVARMPK